MSLADFFQKYFVEPQLGSGGQPYNVFNTIVFAIIGLAAAYCIYRLLRRLGIEIDARMAKAVLPFVFFGSAVRVLTDAGILPRKVEIAGYALHPLLYPFVTPGVYVFTFLALAFVFAAARFVLRKNERALEATKWVGIGLAAIALLPLLPLFKNWLALGEILALASVGPVVFELGCRAGVFKRSLFNFLPVAGQSLDGAATFVGVALLNYSEEHVVANALFSLGSPLLFYFVKMGFALAVAWAASREPDGDEKNFVLFLIAILGLAPGLRDLLRIVAGT